MTLNKPRVAFHPHSLTRNQKGGWLITCFTRSDMDITQVYLRSEPDNQERLTEMKPTPVSANLIKWQARLSPCLHQETTLYLFKMVTTSQQYWLANDGVHQWLPKGERHFRIHHHQKPPAWVARQVFYQIFPDRFANGQPELSVQTDEYSYKNRKCKIVQKQWGEPVAAPHSQKAAFEFYGGDLQGIIDKLDHLKTLGVTALYLNPIFSSPSNHKYDTTDYFNVDPHLGGNEKLAELSGCLHMNGIRLILDAVINHTSAEHPWFDRYQVGENGAYADPSSVYRPYYNFDDRGHYWAWLGINSLPKLDLSNPKLQNYLYRDSDSVLQFWLQAPYNIDGWRLDVAHMLGDGNSANNNHQRIAQMREAIHQQNDQAYFVGEHFYEATSWLQGDQEDGAMNYYGFVRPLRAFLVGSDISYHPHHIDAKGLALWFEQSRGGNPFANQLAQFNLLNSHDTARFLTLLNGDRSRLSLAIVMLFTYIGVPCIYYGDEVGLEGGEDPDCRRCFPWDKTQWDRAVYELYQQMIAIRQQSDSLCYGDLLNLYAYQDTLVYCRWLETSHTLVCINRGAAQTIELDLTLLGYENQTYKELLTGQLISCDGATLQVSMEKCGFALLALQ